MQFDHSDEKPGLVVDDTAKAYLGETARWGKFIAIFGIVICGLLILGGLAFTLLNSVTAAGFAAMGISPLVVSLVYIIGAVICLFPCIALLRFSSNVKIAIIQENSTVLHESFRFLKNYFKGIGILVIIMISIYALMFLFLIVLGGVAALYS